jgi:hypothetical protein
MKPPRETNVSEQKNKESAKNQANQQATFVNSGGIFK